MTDSTRDAYVVRETSSHRMDSTDLRASIQNIIATEGLKQPSYMRVSDSSSAYLPSVDIADNKAAYQKKVVAMKESKLQQPESQTLNLEGGIDGLIDRASADNRLSRDEITARLGTKLSRDEAVALKDLYRNFSAIDTNHNGLISSRDIQSAQERARSEHALDEHLQTFQNVVAKHRRDIDTNNDGQLSAQELRTAGRASSGLNSDARAAINWGRTNL